ncbi:MAG: hypothetical protein ACJASJ_001024 [Candidatus Azotimanducaceae bacterium]
MHADETSDGILKQPVVDQILTLNPFFQAIQIKDAGHNLRREQFEPFMAAIKAFLL